MHTDEKEKIPEIIEQMFKVGAHYGYRKSKRHPSALQYIFGTKNNVEIFDLEKTAEKLEEAKKFVETLAKNRKQILFISGKKEAIGSIRDGAESVEQPYIAGRWIGGTITNFSVIRKRAEKLLDFKSKKQKGEFSKYTKKEQLLIDREIKSLEEKFGGIVSMKELPAAIFIVDSKEEITAVREAARKNIPTIALASSDCDFNKIDYPIPANDSSVASVSFFVNQIVDVCRKARKELK